MWSDPERRSVWAQLVFPFPSISQGHLLGRTATGQRVDVLTLGGEAEAGTAPASPWYLARLWKRNSQIGWEDSLSLSTASSLLSRKWHWVDRQPLHSQGVCLFKATFFTVTSA